MKPTLVYHCAAYTAVDAAEDEGKELTMPSTYRRTENAAKASEKHGQPFWSISQRTTFFDGENQLTRTRRRSTDPQTEYGQNKRMGEELAESMFQLLYHPRQPLSNHVKTYLHP